MSLLGAHMHPIFAAPTDFDHLSQSISCVLLTYSNLENFAVALVFVTFNPLTLKQFNHGFCSRPANTMITLSQWDSVTVHQCLVVFVRMADTLAMQI